MKKCICQLCSCGRHRCPHTLGQQNRVINKDASNKCNVTEYQGRFDDLRPKRGPFLRPMDQIRYEGPINTQTTSGESYVTHQVHVPKPKEPEIFVPNPHKFDAVSEHQEHFKQLNGVPAKIPPYLKRTTLRKPSATMKYVSTKQDDFKPWTSPVRVNIIDREKKYRPPSKPFEETSLHRQDFKHFNQKPNPSARQPDKLQFGPNEMDFQTTTQVFHKPLKAPPARPIERQPEIQPLPKTAFNNTSVFKADFVDHKAIKSAHMFKPGSQIFKTNESMELHTTQADSFKVWPVESRQRKAPEEYKKPEGEIEIKPISRDYSNHGKLGVPARSARPRTKLQRGREFPFNSTTSYSTEFQTYPNQPRRDTLRQSARDGNDIFPKTKDDNKASAATSEFLDKYRRHQVAPATMFRDQSSLFKTAESFAATSLYRQHFRGEKINCPTEVLLKDEGLLSFDHINEEGHKVYEISPRGAESLRRQVTVV